MIADIFSLIGALYCTSLLMKIGICIIDKYVLKCSEKEGGTE